MKRSTATGLLCIGVLAQSVAARAEMMGANKPKGTAEAKVEGVGGVFIYSADRRN